MQILVEKEPIVFMYIICLKILMLNRIVLLEPEQRDFCNLRHFFPRQTGDVQDFEIFCKRLILSSG